MLGNPSARLSRPTWDASETIAMRALCILALTLSLSLASLHSAEAQDRKTKVLNDRDTFAKNDVWIYNDLPAAFDQAKKANKPLLVAFRCIPCEACSHFDEQLLEEQEQMRDLLEQFVCVRVVQANGLDLELFQFDYDQSFHAMFLHADKTIYGRYGTRSEKDEDDDMTLAGFRQAMQRVLELHADYPQNKPALAGKKGSKVPFAIPEQLPSLKGKYPAQLDYAGNVVASCIHCHQVRDAERELHRNQGSIPEQVLFPYPSPEVIGLTMNPNECATVEKVAEVSIAKSAGIKAGDKLVSLDGQPLVSTADLQWVLHTSGESAQLQAEIEREGTSKAVTIDLPKGWKRKGDISWRATTWELRRMGAGGLFLVDLTESERKERDIDPDALALRVQHAGEYGGHAAAKNAGFRKGDVLIAIGKANKRWSESEFLAAALTRPAGTKLPVTVLRGKDRLELQLPIQ
jgi:serine protease Do